MSDSLLGVFAGSSYAPVIRKGASSEIAAIRAELGCRTEQAQLRYYFSAAGIRPLWSGCRVAAPELHRSTLARVEDLLHSREQRKAAIEGEFSAVEAWLGNDDSRPKWLVAELLGPVEHEDIAFLRACGQRLAGRARLVVLRHAAQTHSTVVGSHSDEILCALLLAGGRSTVTNVHRWVELRGWDTTVLAAVTAERAGFMSMGGSGAWRQSQGAARRLGPGAVAALATMVLSSEESPLLSTAALADDPIVAASSVRGDATAIAARQPETLLSYGRAVLHRYRQAAAKPPSAAYATYLASLVAARGNRLSPATCDRVLALAERSGVDAGVRSLLSYHLGQLMAKSGESQRWQRSVRYFSYSRQCLDGNATSGISRIAACYNGEALARYRTGDRAGAVRAERAGLEALSQAESAGGTSQVEQRTLLMANLADVYARETSTELEAIRYGQEALRMAVETGSLAALCYIVPGLARRLIRHGWRIEAERVTRQLLANFDQDDARRRGAERTVVGACCQLASAFAAEDPDRAAYWYGEAADRMRSAAPEALDAILRQLRTASPVPALTCKIGRLDAELADQLATRAQLAPLVSLLEQP
jgi:hypothetical protein